MPTTNASFTATNNNGIVAGNVVASNVVPSVIPSLSSTELMSSLLNRLNPYQLIQQSFFGFGSDHETNHTLIDLDEYCLASIYRYLSIKDLVRCRLVSRRLQQTIDDFWEIRKYLKYDCQLNGFWLLNGQYQFNLDAFDFLLKRMPSLKVLEFERCRVIRSALASCQYNLFETISFSLFDLKQLHLGRALFVNAESLNQLANAFPCLTHLTLSIFNDSLFSLIIEKFRYLVFLNLDGSVLNLSKSSANVLENFPDTIETFVAPADLNNRKIANLTLLCKGPAINLKRFETKITVYNVRDDSKFFQIIGHKMTQLRWFQCELTSASNIVTKPLSFSNETDSAQSSLIVLDSEKKPPPFDIGRYQCENFEKRHFSLIHDLCYLTELRVLILKETDYFDENDSGRRCTLLDDFSLLKIFKNCSKLEMLSISCAICQNKNNETRRYSRSNFDLPQNTAAANRILNRYTKHTCDSKSEANPTNKDDNNNDTSQKNILADKNCDTDDDYLSSSPLLFNCTPLKEKVPNNIDGEHDNTSHYYYHSISDHSIGLIDDFLPFLRVVQLRGVHLGQQSFEALANLKHLNLLQLDSIEFGEDETEPLNKVREAFNRLMLTCLNRKPKVVVHFTNIESFF